MELVRSVPATEWVFEVNHYYCDRDFTNKLNSVHKHLFLPFWTYSLLSKRSLYLFCSVFSLFLSFSQRVQACFQFSCPSLLDSSPLDLFKMKIFAVCLSYTSNHYFKHESSHLRGNKSNVSLVCRANLQVEFQHVTPVSQGSC